VSIFGKENFSKKFQETWQSMQQYTLDFGSTKLIIGGRPLTTIDRLLLYLDRTDIANQFMSNGLGQNAKIDISALKQFAGAWSEYDLAVNSLVELSKGCDVNSEAYLFVKDIISRIGIDNLQESTKLAYLEVFEANKH
jgi:hypothetical protein